MKSPYQLCRRLQLRVPILIVFQPPACPQRRHPRTQFSLAKLIFLKMYVINPPIIFQMKSHSSKSGNLPFVQIGKQFNIFYLNGERMSHITKVNRSKVLIPPQSYIIILILYLINSTHIFSMSIFIKRQFIIKGTINDRP